MGTPKVSQADEDPVLLVRDAIENVEGESPVVIALAKLVLQQQTQVTRLCDELLKERPNAVKID
eukprot:6038225-Prymnesium_polylepis.1